MHKLTRKLLAGLATIGLLTGVAGIAAADGVDVDGDSAVASQNFSISGTSCPTTNTVKAGTLKIVRNETPADQTKHWKAGSPLTLSVSVKDAANNPVATISSGLNDADPLATPADLGWDANGDQYEWDISTSVQPSTPTGVYTVTYELSGANLQTPAGTLLRSDSFTITKDCTGPVVDPCAAVATPAAPTFTHSPDGDNGWYVTTPTVVATSSGATVTYSTLSSGPYGAAPTLSDGETTVYAIATSSTCNKVSPESSQTYKVDTGDPTVALNNDGPSDGASYYEGEPIPAAPTCTASDDTSGVNGVCSVSGYGTGVGPHVVTASATDLAGNVGTSASLSYTVLADTTPPDITPVLDPTDPEGSDGWYRVDVSLTWSVFEGETPASLQKTGCVDQSITEDQSATSYSCSATSLGGSAGPVEKTIKRDGTSPEVTLNNDGPADGASYYEGEPIPGAPTCTASDDTSGLNGVCSVAGYSTAIGEHTVKATASDLAGNAGESATITYTVLDDVTPPVISKVVAPASPDGANGWYKSNVTVTWTVTEEETPASLVTTGCDDQNITADQSATEYTCSATSLGGEAPEDSVTIKRDATAPNVTRTGGPSDGGEYYFGFVPAAPTCTAVDPTPGSGLTGACTISGYSTAVGPHTVTGSQSDAAGNAGSSSDATYTVLGWTTGGFYQPVDMDKQNIVKGGSTVPLKFEVFAGPTELTNPDVVATFQAIKTNCVTGAALGTDEIEQYTSGQTVLRYDSTGGQFIQNWQTPKGAGICYHVVLTLDDGSTIGAYFKSK